MKKLAFILFVLFSKIIFAQDILIENPYQQIFKNAYVLNPSIPKGILEAVAYTQTRFEHLNPEVNESCIGYPTTYGVMGLVQNGKNYFRNNLIKVAQLSGIRETEIKQSPEKSILAYAVAFSALQRENNINSTKLKDYLPILIALSELPVSNDLQNDFAMNAHLYQLCWFLNNTQFQESYEFPHYEIDLKEIFGDNLQVLQAKNINISENKVMGNGTAYKLSQNNLLLQSPDYPSAIYDPTSCNYSSRNGVGISAVTIHFVQGSYAGCISWFKNCNANASAHYVIRSSDGQVTQMVLESLKAWHVGSENPYTVGIEHEGYVNNISWFTNAMYNSSGDLTRDICNSNNINKLRTYYGPSCSGSSSQCLLGACTKVKGHQMFPNQTHTDPGPNWNWEKFYKIVNNTYSITATYTAANGNFYDTGGPGANYSNDERKFWRFSAPNINNITLSFTSFNVENNYDKLFIYNGGTNNAPLIGVYTNTVNPGPITSVNDSLLVEFRSDCGTTASGWASTYVMNGTIVPTPSDNIAPLTNIASPSNWKTAPFTATITDVDNMGGSGVQKGYYQVSDFNGVEWRANNTKGFFTDHFDNAIHPEWTVKTGTWNVSANALVQTDEVSTAANNTNIYAPLTQSLSNRYLYQFLAKFEGSGVSRRAGFHFFVDQPDSSNRNNSYFVWFRLDDQKLQIYKVVNNVFGAPKVDIPLTFSVGQWYDIRTIYDRITGKITVYWNNSPVASWTDPSPIANGNYISFRSGNCKFSIDEIKVFRSRNANVNVPIGTNPGDEMRYQNPNSFTPAGKISSICQDSAQNLSSVSFENVNVDWTAPTNIPFVNDGLLADIDSVKTINALSASWQVSTDQHSNVADYFYSIGTAPGLTDILNWTSSNNNNTVTAGNLNLVHNNIYYFNVRAVNGADLWSSITSSDGIKVDTVGAVIGIKEKNKISNSILVYPNPFNEIINVKDVNAFQSLVLTDALGRVIPITFRKKENAGVLNTGNYYAETGQLSSGVYFIRIEQNGQFYYYKLVK
ncbi:MAG: N-acetylmuramoyl-L-alanine amidase [Sphingobacteriaceae bacterium]|nr:N-acetylmuramoyl-L-alanine amidase [Sphingobacteriaceae bacterium]